MGKGVRTVEIDNTICHVCQCSSGARGNEWRRLSIFYWGIGSESRNWIATVMSYLESHLKERAENAAFLIVAYESVNWNDDFSPWKAQAVFGKDNFGGNADKTLKWLVDKCIPYIEAADSMYIKNAEEIRRYAVGYSLAGLFSLWAYGECSSFAGAVSCSGSLWYKGWLAYVEEHQAAFHRNHTDCIYLSLGDKEDRTKNCLLATVGDNTRTVYEMLRGQPSGARVILEWNTGGHFSEPDIRIAKGIYWILSSSSV